VEYIEKEYTRSGERYEASNGKVIEYFRPSAAFAGKVKAKVLSDDSTKKVSFEFEDGSLVEGMVTAGKNKFLADEPYAKSYNEGQKRWWIERSEGSKVYDKRKLVGQPKEQTGEYSESDMESSVRAESSDKMPGMDMDKDKPVMVIKRETGQAPPTSKQ
jgi:hypothetical protein